MTAAMDKDEHLDTMATTETTAGTEKSAGKKRKRSEIEETTVDAAAAGTIDDDAPVLSHAAQRKAKKKRTKPATAEDEPAPAFPKTDEKSEPKPAVRQFSIWVGNLAFKTMENDLKRFFSECGEITRIHMPRKTVVKQGEMRGDNMGFAYVDFATAEERDDAIKLSESPLFGRKLLIKNGNDYTGRPAKTVTDKVGDASEVPGQPHLSKTAQRILKAQKHPAGLTLFMGNLGFDATQDSIREMLEGHHTAKATKDSDEKDEVEDKVEATAPATSEPKLGLRKIRLGTFEDSGVCKGWAFLDFESPAHATAVLINPRNHHLNGRKLVLEFGSADAVRRGGGPRGPSVAGVTEKGDKRAEGPKKSKRAPVVAEDADADVPTAEDRPAKRRRIEGQETEKPDKPMRPARQGRDGKPIMRRPRPGAALALAVESKQRTGAIVASEGKKITFS